MASFALNLRRAVLGFALGSALGLTLVISAPYCAAAQYHDNSIRDSSVHDRPQMVSFFTGFQLNRFNHGVPLTIGGRYYFPIVPNGFIPKLNDEFGIEGGFDLLFLFDDYDDHTHFGFGVPVDALWDFHFSRIFDAYVKLGFIFGNVFHAGNGNRSYDGFWFDFRPAVGMRLKINDVLYFRAEAGYPFVMAGLGFGF